MMIKLIHGTDSFSSLSRAKEIFEEAKKASSEAEYFSEDFSYKSIDGLFLILEGQSLFASTKIALIKNLSQNKKFKDSVDQIIDRLKKLPEGVTVFFWEGSKLPGNTKFPKYFKSMNFEEVFEEPKKVELKKIAKTLIAKNKLSFTEDALEELLIRTDFSLSYLSNEIGKIALLEPKSVTVEIIKDVVPDNQSSLIWDLTDAITESNKQNAVTAIENLIKNDSDQFMLIPMIGRQLRLMIQVKLLQDKRSEGREIASKLRQPPFIIAKISKYSRESKLSKLQKLFGKLVDLDFAIKTGKIQPEIALSLFCTLL